MTRGRCPGLTGIDILLPEVVHETDFEVENRRQFIIISPICYHTATSKHQRIN